ncbi:MAG: hypothetical protein HZB29_08080 [Nitrospinae bacterium]|nr:hypothetical protein [Nitrospinota bacterium]
MSAFLGPIHYWMFNKITIIESRAMAIAAALEKNGVDAGEVQKAVADYGQKLAGQDLDELVGFNPIHQFLTGLIAKVQVFEARLVELAGGKFDIVLQAAEEHARAEALNAVKAKGIKPDSLEAVYQYVSDYQLEGMPCDPGAQVALNGRSKLDYTHSACNHIQNWEYTSVDIGHMCKLTNAWLKAFITALNGEVEYSLQTAIATGAQSCIAHLAVKEGVAV